MRAREQAVEVRPEALRYLERALKRQWQRYRNELQRCQKKFSEQSVHESRVAARRLLSTIELLEGFLKVARVRKVRRCLKQHLDTFDDLRDTQVQLRAAKPLRHSFPLARLFYQWLLTREERFTNQARACVKRIRPKALSKLVRACREDLRAGLKSARQETAGDRVLRSVDRVFARAKQCRARIEPRRTETIHRTRVAFKRFRYMVEVLAEQVLPVQKEFLEALRQYQTRMGDIQDAEILLRALDKFLRKENIESEPGRELRGQVLSKRQVLIESYLETANQMKDFWPLPGAASRRS